MLQLPLALLHRAEGAVFFEDLGYELPADFGDAEAEQRFVQRSAALFDRSYRGVLDLSGNDVATLLNGLFSSAVKSLAPAKGQPSCLLSAKGRLVAAFHLFHLPGGSFRMILGEPPHPEAVKTLTKYTFLSGITVTDRSGEIGVISLRGPAAGEIVRDLASGAALPAGPLDLAPLRLEGAEVCAVRAGEAPEGGLELWVPRESLDAVWRGLLGAVRDAGGGPAGEKALEALRIEVGVARYGKEYDEESFPNEVRWEHALTYDKCYVGQEIVARMRTYGQVHRRLKGLFLPGDALPRAGAALEAGGEDAGVVTSVARSARFGRGIALALIKRRFWEVDRAVVEAGGGAVEAEIVELPFV